MKTRDVKKMSNQEIIEYWIKERESIRLKRIAKVKKPWTDDEILQNYRFCNVRRMDDKVSKWLYDNWYSPYQDHKNMLYACVIARHFNKPSTLGPLTELIFRKGPVASNTIRSKLIRMRDFGNKVFNSAYIIGNAGVVTASADKVGTGKIEILFDLVFDPIQSSPPEMDYSSMRVCVENLSQYSGFGTFMAGQVVSDLRWAVSGTWEDRNDWAPKGPGSTRGLARYLDMEDVKKTSLTQSVFDANFPTFVDDMLQILPKRITDRLEAMDYQNCLCEYDKYVRTLRGEGTPKNKYDGS